MTNLLLFVLLFIMSTGTESAELSLGMSAGGEGPGLSFHRRGNATGLLGDVPDWRLGLYSHSLTSFAVTADLQKEFFQPFVDLPSLRADLYVGLGFSLKKQSLRADSESHAVRFPIGAQVRWLEAGLLAFAEMATILPTFPLLRVQRDFTLGAAFLLPFTKGDRPSSEVNLSTR